MQSLYTLLNTLRHRNHFSHNSLALAIALGALLCAITTLPALARIAQTPAATDAPAWVIDAWPQAECSGWWVDFTGSNNTPEQWRVKLDGVVITSGTTRGNETVSGQWPPSVDLSQAHAFSVEVNEGGVWLSRSDDNGVGPCAPGKCVTIQAGRSGTVDDAYIYQAFPNANYGGATVLYTGSVNNYPHYSLLWFDLSAIAIPANGLLTGATLTLQMDEASGSAGPSGRVINVHRITSSWSEATITWNSFASQFDATVWSSFTAGNTPVQVNFDVRTLVAGWLSGAYANRGLLLNHASGTLRERYLSSEVASSSVRADRPKLEICIATADYTISKQLLTPNPTRPGQSVQYAIKVVNTGTSWITSLPLRDLYDTHFLSFLGATPSPTDALDDGQLDWADLTAVFATELAPNASFTVTVHFRALADTSGQPNGVTENTAIALGGAADPDGPDGPLGDLLTVGSKSAVAPVQILSPTALHISLAEVSPTHERINLRWTTTTEADVVGFNVLRSVDGAPFERRNLDLIPARRPNSGGAEYRWEDSDVTSGPVYLYRLEVVLVDGRVEPVEMTPVTLQSASFLPLVTR